MATREENLKKINDDLEKLSDEELEQVAGGSMRVTEENAKIAGVKLLKEDGSPGSFGVFWNTGDYYWRGQKIDADNVNDIAHFVKKNGYQPKNTEEAYQFTHGKINDLMRNMIG